MNKVKNALELALGVFREPYCDAPLDDVIRACEEALASLTCDMGEMCLQCPDAQPAPVQEPVGRNITIRAWLDSGANIHSKYQVDFEVDEATWNSLSEDEKDEYAQNFARQRLNWGWNVKE